MKLVTKLSVTFIGFLALSTSAFAEGEMNGAALSQPAPVTPATTVANPSAPSLEPGNQKKPNEPEVPEQFSDVISLRDPFKRPVRANEVLGPRSELEAYSVTDYRMLAAVTGPKHMKAMILAPNGKTYFVSKNDKLGNQRGKVIKITPDNMVIREEIVNVLGQKEDLLTELTLPQEGNNKAKTGP